MKYWLIFPILFVLFCLPVFAQDNPFFSSDKKETINPEQQEAGSPNVLQNLFGFIGELQRTLNSSLSSLSRELIEKNNWPLLFVLIGISVVYGFIHALGPGHGKIIMVSYVLSNPLKVRQGILLGVFIALIHTASAVILVTVFYFILNTVFSMTSRNSVKIMSLISYGLIAVMGIFLIVRIIWKKIIKRKQTDNEQGQALTFNSKNLLFPALAVGIVPCEGALFIMIFFIQMKAYFLGVLISAVMSFGMAFTISVMGLVAMYSKKGVHRLAKSNGNIQRILLATIPLVGSCVIFLFGILMFFSNLT